ncbi:MAG TPA: C4-type zinc ribbon domain-containing protein [Acidimicrobiia bacterium]|nr:C4-type zinc ribbon domain-containing protein [Acidimicrobiia bacterium]
MSELESLLALQARDLALDRLRHQRATLPERAQLAGLDDRLGGIEQTRAGQQREHDDVAGNEQRLADEAQRLAEQATAAEQRLYSGEISSPRELQALQADVDQLRRHQRDVEDRQLGAMEQREPLDAALAALDLDRAGVDGEAATLHGSLDAHEQELDQAAAAERAARDEIAGSLDPGLVAEYERRRQRANGIGAARLSGMTCQGCHLSVPATEVDRIRKTADGALAFCDNCGCILVP